MDNYPISSNSLEKFYDVNGYQLGQQYKEHLSNFREWEQLNDGEALVYPENFGSRMSIDEIALSKGELYTIITNKDAKGKKGCLAAIIKGTKCEIVSKALDKVPIEKRMQVAEITLDLANNMDWICRTNFPNAIITADRFHVQQVVSEAVQEIRIKYRRQAMDEENELIMEARKQREKYIPGRYENGDTKKQLLARSRYLLFKPESKWTESQKKRVHILFKEFPEIQKAYKYAMCFRGIFETSETKDEAKKRLHQWYEKINKIEIPQLISAGNTIERHEGKILNYFYNRETNASAESFNAKLKGFRALLRGVRDVKFFLFRIEKLFA